MMTEDKIESNEFPLHPGSLEGITSIRIDCEEMALAIESDPSLQGVVHLQADGGNNAPSLIRDGEEIILYQRGRFRTNGRPATLFVPEHDCPPISGSQEKGDVNVERVSAAISLRHGMGDVRVVGGTGDLSLESGKGDLIVGNRTGAIDIKLGMGDINVARSRGVIGLDLGKGDALVDSCDGDIKSRIGSGDIAVTDSRGAATIELGSGDISVTRPQAMLLTATNGNGDVVIRSGSLAGLQVRVARGDIVSSTQLLYVPGLGREHDAEAPVTGNGDDENPVTRLLRSKGVEFVAGDQGVVLSTGKLRFEASDVGVRIHKGDFGFEASDKGLRIISGRQEDIGAFVAETSNGDVTIDVPAQLPLRVEVLVNGDVRSDIPLVSVGRPGPRGSTQRFIGVTDPQATERLNLRLKSDRGDIRIRSVTGIPAPAAPPASPAPPSVSSAPPTPPRVSPDAPTARIPNRDAQIRAVLEALGRGDISVAEADRRIADIERGDSRE